MPFRKQFLRILGGLSLLLLLVPLGVGFAIWLQRDLILRELLLLSEEHLLVKPRIDQIDFRFFSTFPDVVIDLDSVVLHESCGDRSRRLATVGQIHIGIRPWALLWSDYTIRFIEIEGATVIVRRLPDRTNNYDILKKKKRQTNNAKSSASNPRITFKEIRLKDIHFQYNEEFIGGVKIGVELQKGKGFFQAYGEKLRMSLYTQNAQVPYLYVGKSRYAEDLPIRIDHKVEVVQDQKVTIFPGTVGVALAELQVKGWAGTGNTHGLYNLDIDNAGSSLQVLALLLPKTVRKQIGQYKTTGNVYFRAKFLARDTNSYYPQIWASFGAEKATLTQQKSTLALKDVSFKGSFTLPPGNSLQKAQLRLKGLEGTVNHTAFKADFDILNFNKPKVGGFLKAKIPLEIFAQTLRQQQYRNPSGFLDVDVTFATPHQKEATASGSITMQDIGFLAGERGVKFSNWNGKLSLNGNTLVANPITGFIGKSDIELKGRIRHLLSYLTEDAPRLWLEVALKSNLLDMNELLLAREGKKTKEAIHPTETYRLSIEKSMYVRATCHVAEVRFRRFVPKKIQGLLLIENQKISLRNFQFKEAGGYIKLSGFLDATKPKIPVQTTFNMRNLQINRLFYVLENFHQNTLTHHQLKGIVQAKGNISLIMNNTLAIAPKSVKASVTFGLNNGRLTHFEPAQVLSRFVSQKELNNLRFTTSGSAFSIYNEVVTLPEIDIKTNIIRCFVHGTHTFQQEMDYHLRIPLKYINRSSIGAKDSSANGNVLLTLKGKPNDFRVSYDVATLRSRIRAKFTARKRHFSNLFRTKAEQAPDSPTVLKPIPNPVDSLTR